MVQAIPQLTTFDEFIAYLGLSGRRYIGTPKQPTVSVYEWVDGEYQVTLFGGADRILSPTVPELSLTLEQVLQSVGTSAD